MNLHGQASVACLGSISCLDRQMKLIQPALAGAKWLQCDVTLEGKVIC